MKVLATTDGSDFSLKALAQLGKLLPVAGTEILLLSVFRSPRTLTYGADPFNVSFERMVDQFRESAEDDCARGREILVQQGFSVKTLTLMGNPAETILELAEQDKPDLVMVGSHGRSGFQRFLLGSVSERVLRHARVSVLVVKLPRS